MGLDPSNQKLWFHHGLCCAEIGDLDRALESANRALAIQPSYVEALNLQGAILQDLKKHDEAEYCFRKALDFKADFAPALSNLGLSLLQAGFSDEAVKTFRRAVAAPSPTSADYSNLLLALNYSNNIDGADMFAEHRRWAERYADGLAPAVRPEPRQHPDGRLRIGYVSADFRLHPATTFLYAFLPYHRRHEFHVFAYGNVRTEDEATARIRSMIETWRPIHGQSDEQVARLVREDQIDILVDLGGHSGDNRLLVFARQPAPVQVAVLCYPNTTGLRTMQYRTTDDHLDPPDSDVSVYTEKLIRLPEISWCYEPSHDVPEVSPSPNVRVGRFTFGSLNNMAKVTDEVVSIWARILLDVPASRLAMLVNRSSLCQSRIESLFARAGVNPERVEFHARMPQREYWRLFENIDLALDPFPYNGVTTTSDTLWMGVPLVTLAGKSCRARQGVCQLKNVGLGQFIAKDIDEYVRIATTWASRVDELGSLRSRLRDQMRQSPIVRGDLFAGRLEAAFRLMSSLAGQSPRKV